MTPATDPLGYCGFIGPEVPREDGLTSAPYDGQAACSGGSTLDFNNNVVFERSNLERQRFLFGVNYRYEMLTAGAQFMTDLVSPAKAQSNDRDQSYLEDCDSDGNCDSVPRQWQLGLELGVAF